MPLIDRVKCEIKPIDERIFLEEKEKLYHAKANYHQVNIEMTE